MPAFVLGNAIAGVLMRHTRSAMLQALESDYVRTARAKGLRERRVVLKHAMRNALTPVITLGALEFGTLLSGAVLTEQIFTIPGFGKLIVDAVFNRDYAVVQGVVLVTATIYIALNLLADIAYVLVNPRLRADGDDRRSPLHAELPPPTNWRARRGAPAPAVPAQGRGGRPGRHRAVRSCWRCLRRWSRPTIRPRTSWTPVRKAPSARTGSAPTRSAATCSPASSAAPAPRCWPALISVGDRDGDRRAARAAGRLWRRLRSTR